MKKKTKPVKKSNTSFGYGETPDIKMPSGNGKKAKKKGVKK